MFLDFRRDVFLLFLLFKLVNLNGGKVKLVKVIDVREIFFEPFHELGGKVGFIELIFVPDGADGLGPVVGEFFFEGSEPE